MQGMQNDLKRLCALSEKLGFGAGVQAATTRLRAAALDATSRGDPGVALALVRAAELVADEASAEKIAVRFPAEPEDR